MPYRTETAPIQTPALTKPPEELPSFPNRKDVDGQYVHTTFSCRKCGYLSVPVAGVTCKLAEDRAIFTCMFCEDVWETKTWEKTMADYRQWAHEETVALAQAMDEQDAARHARVSKALRDVPIPATSAGSPAALASALQYIRSDQFVHGFLAGVLSSLVGQVILILFS